MLVPTHLAAAAAFNLICTVTSSGPNTDPSESNNSGINEMRVDFVSKRFCLDKCEETLPIQHVTLSHIVLFDAKTGQARSGLRGPSAERRENFWQRRWRRMAT